MSTMYNWYNWDWVKITRLQVQARINAFETENSVLSSVVPVI